MTVVTESTTTQGLGTLGFEAFAQYQVKSAMDSGPPQNSNGSFARHTYRVGRTVIAVSIDTLSLPSDPPTLNAKMADDVTKALTAVYARFD